MISLLRLIGLTNWRHEMTTIQQKNTSPKSSAVAQVYDAFKTIEGDGFDVMRAIPSKQVNAVGPIIFLDHFGPIDIKAGEAKGASAHPHAGIETLTLLLEGSSVHKDSMGNHSSMRPNEVQWMRAGAGIIHDESPDPELLKYGGRNHGVQLWLNMPKGKKHDAPEYQHYKADDIPVLLAEDAQSKTRVIAGVVAGETGPVRTNGYPVVAHTSFVGAGEFVIPTPQAAELAVYVMIGGVNVGANATPVSAGQIALLTQGDVLTIRNSNDAIAELLIIGGDALDAPIVRYGPFVMNSRTELEQTVRDYHAGRMGTID
jgi:redox-sensitive bicupin YhaK (pirin superfamily)